MESSSSTEPEKTIIEVVKMLEDGSLEIGHSVVTRNGPRFMPTVTNSKPGDPDYIEFGTRHSVTKPGQISVIRKELRNGVWNEGQEKSGNW